MAAATSLIRTVAISGIFALGATACGGSKTSKGQLNPGGPTVEYPSWVNQGSTVEGGKDGVFFGVGSASGIRNHSLARSTADNRARNEISKLFETYSASLMKDYQASTTAGDFSATSEEQRVEQAIKTFTANTLNGVEIDKRWIGPDGTIYARAKLDMDAFLGQIEKAQELNARTKEAVRRAAEKSFEALEAEEEKRR